VSLLWFALVFGVGVLDVYYWALLSVAVVSVVAPLVVLVGVIIVLGVV